MVLMGINGIDGIKITVSLSGFSLQYIQIFKRAFFQSLRKLDIVFLYSQLNCLSVLSVFMCTSIYFTASY